MAVDRYSQMVAWLKVALPLAALGLLSTLFLLSRAIDPTASIPFATTEVQERMRDQQVTGPFFSGMTANGDQIAFMAERLTTLPGASGRNRAEDIFARIDLNTGAQIILQSKIASVDIAADTTELSGEVVITTSAGYEIMSDALRMRMSQLDIGSPGEISATGPLGAITAGQMQLSVEGANDAAQLLFTNQVKLLYEPVQGED